MDLKTEILKLQKSRLLRNTVEIIDFESAIENIISFKDMNIVQELQKNHGWIIYWTD
ncbi:UNVERIFIED_CONTAM: hypothetical protein Cloal_1803 [Acetivibrio alkalicellulosi]